MIKNRTQTFSDGIVKIYKVNNETGDLILINALRYHERTIGYNRYYKALDRDIKIDLLLRCQDSGELLSSDTDILVAIPKDNMPYKIMQIQYPEDISPPVVDLTLEKVSKYSDVNIASYAQFNCEIDVYGKIQITNELEEIDFEYNKIKSIWAEITAETGAENNLTGNVQYTDISHKFIIKNADIELTNDMYFMFEGKRYDVKYFLPNYKYKDVIEVFCSMVTE